MSETGSVQDNLAALNAESKTLRIDGTRRTSVQFSLENGTAPFVGNAQARWRTNSPKPWKALPNGDFTGEGVRLADVQGPLELQFFISAYTSGDADVRIISE